MAQTPKAGRPSLFRGKRRDKAVRAYLTDKGWTRFEARRKAIAKANALDPARVSDGDVVETLLTS